MNLKAIATIILSIIVAFIGYQFLSARIGVQEGNIAPEITAELINGQPFNLSDYRGDYVLIDFWGSWCAPCRRENPSLVKLYQEYEDKKSTSGEGFKIINIALEKIKGQAEFAIKKDNLYWDDHVISMSRIVLASSIARSYSVSEVPTKFLIGPDGKILLSNPNLVEIEKTLRKNLF